MDDLLLLLSPTDIEETLARRVRSQRKAKGWTQAELARRSGLSIATVARLEQAGQGQISSLIRIVSALGRLEDFDGLLQEATPRSMAELRRLRGNAS
jgi:transcriptional regulator with XRE-family HTH domain